MTAFLITGAAGFIGSNLAEGLVERGHRVVGVDNFLTGKRANLEWPGSGSMTFVEADIRDRDRMVSLMDGIDFVLHHAALASVPWSVEDPVLANDHNVNGTLSVLLGARDAGVEKVVMACTSAVYGNTDRLPAREDQPVECLSPYASTKLMGEQYLALFRRVWGVATVGLRYFNVYGARQDPTSAYAAAIPIFASRILAGERSTIFGDGEQTRDFIHVDDVVEANLKACEAGDEASGQFFNIGGGRRVTVNELFSRIARLLGGEAAVDHGPERPGDARHSVADISKAARVLGFEPSLDLEAGLARTVDWYRENL